MSTKSVEEIEQEIKELQRKKREVKNKQKEKRIKELGMLVYRAKITPEETAQLIKLKGLVDSSKYDLKQVNAMLYNTFNNSQQS